MKNCRVCNSEYDSETICIKEKMFGIDEQFAYSICPNCKCMQINEIPQDLSRYYPKDYYSFEKKRRKSFKKLVKQKHVHLLSLLKGRYHKTPEFANFGIEFSERKKNILDIGCGDGHLLSTMGEYGFNRLTGIDPLISTEIKKRNLKILKQTITEHKDSYQKYDIIMSHHSLEHMPNPMDFFAAVKSMLKNDGRLILRIPIYPNYIWDIYGVDWIQLDAPRHLYIFHLDTIRYLCDKNNLEIIEIIDDSQPWALASTKFCKNGGTHAEFVKQFRQNEAIINDHNEGLKRNVGDTARIIIKLKDE